MIKWISVIVILVPNKTGYQCLKWLNHKKYQIPPSKYAQERLQVLEICLQIRIKQTMYAAQGFQYFIDLRV